MLFKSYEHFLQNLFLNTFNPYSIQKACLEERLKLLLFSVKFLTVI